MKKILLVIPSLAPAGGIERIVTTIANQLSSLYETSILTFDDKDSFYEVSENVGIYTLKSKFSLNMENRLIRVFQTALLSIRVINSLRKYLNKNIYDYVYITHPLTHMYLLLSGFDYKKIVISEHGASNNYNAVYRLLRRLTYKYCHAYCVPTKTDCEIYRNMGLPVVYTPHYRPEMNYKKVSGDSKVILSIGRLTPDKQHMKLLKMWNEISKVVENDWILKIVGSGELNEEMQRYIDNNKMRSIVKLIPASKNIEEFYSDSSVFVLTSRSEGFGMVLLEAISFGLPVVAFDCPSGPRDIISSDNGFLVHEDNEEKFKSHIIELISNSSLRNKMIDSAFISAQRWSKETITSIWERVFK